jgi:hypothetical protein
MGAKFSDEFGVPFCRGHHRAAHYLGEDTACCRQIGPDLIKAASQLWQ